MAAGVEDVGLEVPEEPVDAYVCPRCGQTMQLKKAFTGKFFFGCKAYPACKETRDSDGHGNPLPSNFGNKRDPLEVRARPPLTVWERLMADED